MGKEGSGGVSAAKIGCGVSSGILVGCGIIIAVCLFIAYGILYGVGKELEHVSETKFFATPSPAPMSR
jgi:hypothetical protein